MNIQNSNLNIFISRCVSWP